MERKNTGQLSLSCTGNLRDNRQPRRLGSVLPSSNAKKKKKKDYGQNLPDRNGETAFLIVPFKQEKESVKQRGKNYSKVCLPSFSCINSVINPAFVFQR